MLICAVILIVIPLHFLAKIRWYFQVRKPTGLHIVQKTPLIYAVKLYGTHRYTAISLHFLQKTRRYIQVKKLTLYLIYPGCGFRFLHVYPPKKNKKRTKNFFRVVLISTGLKKWTKMTRKLCLSVLLLHVHFPDLFLVPQHAYWCWVM